MMGSRGMKGAREYDALSCRSRRLMKIRRQAIRAAKRTFSKRVRREVRECLRDV
jgi:hypothetical protein